jgi:hypothetical protein
MIVVLGAFPLMLLLRGPNANGAKK